jgi:hypothetical protein
MPTCGQFEQIAHVSFAREKSVQEGHMNNLVQIYTVSELWIG